jgi:hypothetical protein
LSTIKTNINKTKTTITLASKQQSPSPQIHIEHKKTTTHRTHLHGGCLIRGRNRLPFASIWVDPPFFGEVRVIHLFSILYCSIMSLYVVSSVLWCPLRFPHTNVIYVICVCLRVAVSNTYCVVFFWFSLSSKIF